MRLKWLGIGAGAVIALGLIAVGPDLIGLYRLQNYVAASDKTYQADGPWPHLSDACVLCHLSTANRAYPSLAGQPAPYLVGELHAFATGKRANPTMGPLAMSLSEADIQSLAAYMARQPASANGDFQADPAMVARGQAVATADGCSACHGPDLMGHDQFPRLAGQGYDYLVEQLDAFADGQRTEASGTMSRLTKAASAADRKALAAYIATLTVVKK